MRALVIGADGFAGRWLVRHLVESGDEVAAAVGPGYGNEPLPQNLEPLRLDVRDPDGVNAVVLAARPDVTYYLAGVSRADSRDNLAVALDVSVKGALNVLGAIARLDQPTRLLHVGSSHMYASSVDGLPITEATALRPSGTYGAAKAAAEAALDYLAGPAGIEFLGIRAFNHIGPGQAAGFVIPSLARQLVAIERSEQEATIRAGNLEASRDFTDVRDVVRAYRLAAQHGLPGEKYNVASGRATRISEMLGMLSDIAGVDAQVVSDRRLARSEDALTIVGDAARLRAATGWQPAIPIRQTLADILDATREAAARQAT